MLSARGINCSCRSVRKSHRFGLRITISEHKATAWVLLLS